MILRRLCLLAFMALCLHCVCSCAQQTKSSNLAQISISGAGATFPEPLYITWIKEYAKVDPNVHITYAAVGSGEGIRRFLGNDIDFGASDAAMTDAEMAKVERGVRLIPATAGLVVIVYNLPEIRGELGLSRPVYLDIFTGKIKNWNDQRIGECNPGINFPAREILLVTRQDSSGTTFAFTNHLASVADNLKSDVMKASKSANWPQNSMTARGNEGVAGRVKISEGSIGYVEYGFAQRAGLNMAALENRAGEFIKPSPESGSYSLKNTEYGILANLRMFIPDPIGKESYPLVTYSWLLLYEKYSDPEKLALLKNFLNWSLDEGQSLSPALGYCRIPFGAVQKAKSALADIK